MIEKIGSWYSFKGERIGQGRENARQTLLERPELRTAMEQELRIKLGLNGPKKVSEFELTEGGKRIPA